MTNNLVSILLPVYNAEESLSDSLTSLLEQTYSNIEIIAIDDFSRDNSYEVLRKFAKKYKRLKISHNVKHYGLSVCLNRAVKQASGTYVGFMEASDLSNKRRIEEQVTFLEQNQKVAAVGTQFTMLSKNGRIREKSSLPLMHDSIASGLLEATSIQPETMLINKTLLPKDLLQFKKTTYPLLYTDLLIKISQYARLANLPEAFYYRREIHKYHRKNTNKLNRSFSLLSLWLKSTIRYDYRPSLRSVFNPLLEQA